MAKALFTKTLGGGLYPFDESARDAIRSLPIGALVSADVRRPRNEKHHRKFFAMLGLIYQNQSIYKDPDDMLDAIKVYVGHCTWMTLRDGTKVPRPKSIAWHRMDQAAFEKFYDAVVNVIVTEIIPGLNRSDLERELLDFVGTDARTLAATEQAA